MKQNNAPHSVLVMGASPEVTRYAYMATRMLKEYGHLPVCFGKRAGLCAGEVILNQFPQNKKIDIVTLYLNPSHQESYYQSIIDLNPRRVIFNPGTENNELQELLNQKGIPWEEACTLVLLRTGQWQQDW